MPKLKTYYIRLDEKDKLRLDLICEVFGVSLPAAIRVSIRAACVKLGIEKDETSDDLLK